MIAAAPVQMYSSGPEFCFGQNFLYMVVDQHETVLAQPFMWALVAALAPQIEQVSPLPRVTPPVPEPVVAGDVNKDDVSHLSPLVFL